MSENRTTNLIVSIYPELDIKLKDFLNEIRPYHLHDAESKKQLHVACESVGELSHLHLNSSLAPMFAQCNNIEESYLRDINSKDQELIKEWLRKTYKDTLPLAQLTSKISSQTIPMILNTIEEHGRTDQVNISRECFFVPHIRLRTPTLVKIDILTDINHFPGVDIEAVTTHFNYATNAVFSDLIKYSIKF